MHSETPAALKSVESRSTFSVRLKLLIYCALSVLCAAGNSTADVQFNWAVIGKPGAMGVNYTYRMSQYEVTQEQYAEFLNAIAADDTYNLYSGGGITRAGSPGSYSYTVQDGFNAKPMERLNWFDAARFANWLHNGQPAGAQDWDTTEYGAYDMHIPSEDPEKPYEDPVRLPGARFFLPSEREWSKAAYYDPRDTSEGGPPGDVHGWGYPTMSNDPPIAELPPGGTNSANYAEQVGAITDVGAYTSTMSYFGLFDMIGNAREWNEGIYSSGGGGQAVNFVSVRGISGGAWFSSLLFIEQIYSLGADLRLAGLRIATTAEPQLTMNWITVGDPGNGDDPADGDHLSAGVQSFGAVDYVYRIGQEEVTNGQYASFLNAIDPEGTNLHHTYSDLMAGDEQGGILFEPTHATGLKYAVKSNRGNMPVNFVSWFSAARFANWMNNGRGTVDTETGAYDMSMPLPVRLEGAKVFLPSEAEWYKAAYYDPRSSSAGGPPDDDNYWAFPTQSDAEPFAERAPGGVSSANLAAVGGGLVERGAYEQTTSYYGVFDLAGNVWEWNEAIVDGAFGDEVRSVRGGGWGNSPGDSGAAIRPDTGPSLVRDSIGFRVASAVPVLDPLPGDMNDDGAVNTSDIEAFVLALIDPEMFTEQTGLDSLIGDINQDGVLNASDIDPFVDILANGSLEIAAEASNMISQLLAIEAPFRILHVAQLSNEIEIAWASVPGRGYTVEFSEDLAQAWWTPLNTIAIVATETSTLFRFSPVDTKVGYYRVTERNP
ncbi:MAG: SUMF1/EgtB/PvdO family nonheme iron enzyme [Verrucomicrobiales bacterium]